MKHKKHEIDIFGDEYWYDDNGEHHRNDGPAIIHPNGDSGWC
jgi:hypothetical protein